MIKNIALVHDFLIRLGGGERVMKTLSEMFPQAPIYTLLYDEKKTGAEFPKARVITSGLQKLPKAIRSRHRFLLPLMPRAVEEWDFSKFDLVISSSSAFSHGIITGTATQHISYIHSPMRYAWDWTHEYQQENHLTGLKKIALAHVLKRIRMWDQASADRPDKLIANSKNIRNRIRKYYRREADVVYPPVDLARFTTTKSHENFFLIISNLTPFKRIDLAVQLFTKIGRKLVIIGEGPERRFLESIAGDTIQFLGRQDDEVCAEYMHNCRAFLFCGEDDFGITPVEAMACGKPVLAFGKGGALETVVAGVTGEFFDEPSVASLEHGLATIMKNEKNYAPAACSRQAEKFSQEIFIKQIRENIAFD